MQNSVIYSIKYFEHAFFELEYHGIIVILKISRFIENENFKVYTLYLVFYGFSFLHLKKRRF